MFSRDRSPSWYRHSGPPSRRPSCSEYRLSSSARLLSLTDAAQRTAIRGPVTRTSTRAATAMATAPSVIQKLRPGLGMPLRLKTFIEHDAPEAVVGGGQERGRDRGAPVVVGGHPRQRIERGESR